MKKITFLMLALLMAVCSIQAENIIYLDQLKDGKTYTLQHGDVLTGTLSVNATLKIAKGVFSDPSSDVTFTTTAAPAPAATDQIYSVYNDGVLTYYYDSKMSSRAGTKEIYDPDNTRFQGYAENVESAIIDKSVGKANPTTLKNFFYGGRGDCSLKNMTNIYGLENIEMYDVTDMSYMFCNCKSLVGLDLSQFNTLYVKNMNAMFYGCSSLEELNIYMFEFNSLESMKNMFYGCSSLRTIYCNRNLSNLGN